uniref:AsmA protein n=1 Tax=Candidatus Kentrum sp. TUN TaxID=2126343 RepID=A0A450ZHT2_9GAMM|nr:MAG: AsmA protein [Candidatus Kentron sp. TUN]VFK55206.1 MAG: AsmA protein [Candidatus Kentron sp. TUN]
MRALLKVIGTIIGIVIILLVAMAVIVPVYFHPNDYKEEIAAVVQEKTGREFKIEGDIVLSVFPWLVIELGPVELGNAPGFPDGKFARLERMEIGVKLLPLLGKRLEMRTVKIHGLELNLARDKNGRTNWSDLVASRSDNAQTQSEGKKGEEKPIENNTTKAGMPIAILGIGGLDIQNAALRWSDVQNSQYYRLEDMTIKTGAIAPESITLDEPVNLEVSFNIEGNKPRISGRVDTNTKFTADFAKQVFQLANLNVSSELSGESLPNGEVVFNLDANLDADLTKQTLHVKDLAFIMGQINANGNITVSQLLEKPAFDAAFQLEEFNPRTLLVELSLQVPETTDPKVLTLASLSTTIQGTTEQIHLKPLTVRLDETTLNGALQVVDFSTPAIRFDLHADTIDADHYLPPTRQEKTGDLQDVEPAPTVTPATPGSVVSEAAQFPLDVLRALDVDGKARIDDLIITKLKLSDLALDLKAKDGEIRVRPAVSLYQGNYSGDINIDARGDAIRIGLDEKLADVQVGPLLHDLQGDDLVSGKFQIALQVKADGKTPEELKKTLAGNANFEFSDGMIKGIDMVGKVCNAAELALGLGSGNSSDEGTPEGTEFQKLTGQFPIESGRIGINDTLALKAPMLRIKGESGAIDLGANRLDKIKFIVKPSFTCKGQGGKALNDLSGVDIPFICNGPMKVRSCLPNIKGIIKRPEMILGKEKADEIKVKVKEKTDELKEKLEEKAKEKAKEILKDLF